MALETDVESLRGQLDEASDRLQQMGALQAQVARLQEQCNQLQTEKSEAEIQLQVCAAFSLRRHGAGHHLRGQCAVHVNGGLSLLLTCLTSVWHMQPL